MKQALHSSGANVTSKHITDVSMCALFLLEAAKHTDTIFGVQSPSTAHTISDSRSDTTKMQRYMVENEINHEPQRNNIY